MANRETPRYDARRRIGFDGSHPAQFAPSTPAIAACFPKLKAEVKVELETDKEGRDEFEISARGLPPRTAFTVFLLEVPGSPFGAAEYIGDFTTNATGSGDNEFDLIVAEAFSSTLVNGARVRAELNHVGFWFADPAGDDVCFGHGSGPVTPFDGDNQAGAQVMNSANALPGFRFRFRSRRFETSHGSADFAADPWPHCCMCQTQIGTRTRRSRIWTNQLAVTVRARLGPKVRRRWTPWFPVHDRA